MEGNRRVKLLFLAIALVGAYLMFEIYKETHTFVVTRYSVNTNQISEDEDAKKIVFLSDFHNQIYGENSKELVDAIRREKPDLILIGGDMLVGKKDCKYDVALTMVKQLPEIAPVYYANGNHEQRLHEKVKKYGNVYWEYKKELEDAGVKFLVNESTSYTDEIKIIGLEIPKDAFNRWEKYPLQTDEITERIGRAPEEFTILLAHHPAYAKRYWEWGADLVLSGHLHGGIVRIPYVGAIISPQFHLLPQYSGGIYEEENKTIIVSRGLGTHTIPVRLWNPAELIVISLKGIGG